MVRTGGPAGGQRSLKIIPPAEVSLAGVRKGIPIRTPTLWCRMPDMPDMTTMGRDGRDALCLAQLEAPLREQAMARFAALRPHLEDECRWPGQPGTPTAAPLRPSGQLTAAPDASAPSAPSTSCHRV